MHFGRVSTSQFLTWRPPHTTCLPLLPLPLKNKPKLSLRDLHLPSRSWMLMTWCPGLLESSHPLPPLAHQIIFSKMYPAWEELWYQVLRSIHNILMNYMYFFSKIWKIEKSTKNKDHLWFYYSQVDYNILTCQYVSFFSYNLFCPFIYADITKWNNTQQINW